ncbi:dephospho-CoA kinase [bacterium 336/3]|nr:dephospho-CoA kinase [bacterium 336/3]
MNKKPLEVGITGGIGSGKSTVAHIFAVLGAPIYDADSRAKYLMSHNEPLKKSIQEAFGKESYHEDGSVNRAYLASQVFNDEQKVKQINALVHPKVAEDYISWVQEQIGKPYVIREAALMIESGSHKFLDKLITVFAPEEIRIKRVKARDPQRSEEEIKAIIGKQLPEEEKLRLADYIIYNDDTKPVITQVLALHKLFIS